MTDWECLSSAGAEFKLFEGFPNIVEAVASCEAENATLARISSEEEFFFVKEMVTDVTDAFWIGLHDPLFLNKSTTDRFVYK